MEDWVITGKRDFNTGATPHDYVRQGILMVPFTILNPCLSDLVQGYMDDILTSEAQQVLHDLDIFPDLSDMTVLNAYTPKTYRQFLQMIVKENYCNHWDQDVTVEAQVISGDPVNYAMLPTYWNRKQDVNSFNGIEHTPYAIFSPDKLWVIRIKTRFVRKGVTRDLVEYNVYVPQRMIL